MALEEDFRRKTLENEVTMRKRESYLMLERADAEREVRKDGQNQEEELGKVPKNWKEQHPVFSHVCRKLGQEDDKLSAWDDGSIKKRMNVQMKSEEKFECGGYEDIMVVARQRFDEKLGKDMRKRRKLFELESKKESNSIGGGWTKAEADEAARKDKEERMKEEERAKEARKREHWEKVVEQRKGVKKSETKIERGQAGTMKWKRLKMKRKSTRKKRNMKEREVSTMKRCMMTRIRRREGRKR